MKNTTSKVAEALGQSIGSTISEGMPEERQREWSEHAASVLKDRAESTASGIAASRSAKREAQKQRVNGTVQWFNDNKGYGFISSPLGDDAYFHISEWDEEDHRPQDGDRVVFTPAKESRGLAAKSVRAASDKL